MIGIVRGGVCLVTVIARSVGLIGINAIGQEGIVFSFCAKFTSSFSNGKEPFVKELFYE